jgi:dTDP-4-amino-4,6-dideoxygalactose transaminase
VKLAKLDEWNDRRRNLAALYLTGLGGAANLTLPFVPEWTEPVWHLFVVRHPQRDAVQQKLAAADVGTLIHYPVPAHLSGAYAGGHWIRGAFPVAENLADTVLSLPIGPHLSREQTGRVVAEIGRQL